MATQNIFQPKQGDVTLKANLADRRSQAIFAAMLGLALVLAVGFLPMGTVHNAAHDTRHVMAFPCH